MKKNVSETIQMLSVILMFVFALLASVLQLVWFTYIAIIAALLCLLIILLSFKSILKFKKKN